MTSHIDTKRWVANNCQQYTQIQARDHGPYASQGKLQLDTSGWTRQWMTDSLQIQAQSSVLVIWNRIQSLQFAIVTSNQTAWSVGDAQDNTLIKNCCRCWNVISDDDHKHASPYRSAHARQMAAVFVCARFPINSINCQNVWRSVENYSIASYQC